MDTGTLIINWFVENSLGSKDEIESNLEANYFEKGWIDSFQFIEFLAFLEEEFGVTFENEEFQNREFATISGLKKIIKNKNG